MSSVTPPNAPRPVPAGRPVPPPSGGGGTGAPTIDPIKLLKKWKFVLAAAVFVGIVFGVAIHMVWVRTYPIYESAVTFEAKPPPSADLLEGATLDADFMEQFMATQASRMESRDILERVTQDPRLQAEAPEWSKRFIESNGAFNYQKATEDLEKRVSAGPMGGTSYVRLKVTWTDKEDVASMARLMKEAYYSDLQTKNNQATSENRAAIQDAITNTKREIDNLTERRNRLIRDEEVTGLAEQQTITRERLSIIAVEMNNIGLELREMEVQLERMNKMVESEGGIRYNDSQRQMVNQSPIVQQLKANKDLLETRLKELRQMGFMPGHREYKMIETQIDATEQQITVTSERELAKLFDAEKDMLESQIMQSQAKIADLTTRQEELEQGLEDMTRTITEIRDITDQIQAMNNSLADRRAALEDIQTASSTSASNRMIVVESARIPDRPTMPKILLMVPLGVVLITGLTAASILAAEFLDQRVKSPSDLAAMPRTKILGTVPLADEDPAVGGQFDTVMRDATRSAVAESFRQIRTGVLKKLERSGHKTCLVFAGMPGSGASAVTINLGLACSSVDRKVLIIDANFRRASIHKTLGLREGPGLGEVLAGSALLKDVVQSVPSEGGHTDVLTAGASSSRVFERLGTEAMTRVLAEAKEHYDIVFIDTAPAIVAGDASSLAQRCDASIQITRAMAETRGMVGRVKNEFSDAPAEMLGIVVNAVRSAAGGYMKRNIRTSTRYHEGDPGAVPNIAPGKPQRDAPGENAA